MKRSAKSLHPQMNLPLHNVPATAAAGEGQQNELTIALMELLLSAAEEEENKQAENGGEDESEAYA